MNILLQYVKDVLTPSKEQVSFLRSRIRRIRAVLTQNSKLAPKEVHIGGSFEKGTMLSYKPDADIVCIYNRSKEVAANWRKLVTLVYEDLQKNFPNMEVEEAGRLAIHISAEFLDGKINREANFDVVPCYYVNSPAKMKDHTGSKHYAAITTIWHSRYICGRYKKRPFFTDIVRLLKDWKNEQDVPLKSIHLELLAADTYDYNMDEIEKMRDDHIPRLLDLCLEDIIDTLDGYPVLPYNWKYCKDEDFAEQYKGPVIIDPANPADNLLSVLNTAGVKKIRRKIKITRENLAKGYYADIFNRKGFTKFFD
jgi:RNA polymerase subunit RPABC4/transcription elongation factor Spt4